MSGRYVLVSDLAGREVSSGQRLPDSIAHHLVRVLRLDSGAALRIAPGDGRVFDAALIHDGAHARMEDVVERASVERKARLTLCASLIKGSRWDSLLEKAGECGADRVIPIEADRSVVALDDRRAERKTQRWQEIVEGANRQSEQPFLTCVERPRRVEEALEHVHGAALLFADETDPETRWPERLESTDIALFIGPEGGFSEREREALLHANAIAIGLGPALLRAETAATVALGLCMLRYRHGLI